MTSALLLPSPFLPAHVFAPLADALGRRGWGVVVSTPPAAPSDGEEVLGRSAPMRERAAPDVVLAHSNAGRYAAHVAPERSVVVYLDAALPPESGDAPLAPAALADALAAVTGDDGLLPPWTRWWDEEDLAPVVPDPEVLARIRADEPRVPLAYLRARLAAPDGWQDATERLPRLRRDLRPGDRDGATAGVAGRGPRRGRAPAPPPRPRGRRGGRRRAGRPAGCGGRRAGLSRSGRR